MNKTKYERIILRNSKSINHHLRWIHICMYTSTSNPTLLPQESIASLLVFITLHHIMFPSQGNNKKKTETVFSSCVCVCEWVNTAADRLTECSRM